MSSFEENGAFKKVPYFQLMDFYIQETFCKTMRREISRKYFSNSSIKHMWWELIRRDSMSSHIFMEK